MRTPIIIPSLGTGSEPIRVNGWFVSEGDWVVAGDLLVELLVAGITFDLPSEASGHLVSIAKPLDSATESGDILGWLDTSSADVSDADFSS